ncbi:malto-oligosyltrehalose synthase [Phormidium sp. CLA17]|uniref:malto-oligosyltrehalose synthase n=1 Tax=Leptolyngbya sp. Cla-17 TaxID=2803751 RepID=UPI00149165D0|nr:malto-oligosyltrehalose synthase [Leptolyngbya sp. Cla-17]MBM0742888.1 malto-oligosyltrehalose synthase [Leptolyngbya sp. Cla-17]
MKIPIATYRLQFHAGFNFEAAHAISNYLAALGISDLYASPIFKAKVGSSHGYDVVDPNQINPEIGTPKQFDALVNTLQQHQIGWLQDIVPNHMAYDSENHYLMDILENGPDSEAIEFFDIEWNHAYESFKGRVLAPLLGDLYGNCLEKGEIQLTYDATGLSVNYNSLKLPVRIESYARFITTYLGQLTKALGRQHPDFIKLLGSLYLIKSIPAETKGRERSDQIGFVKGLLWELYSQNAEIKNFFDANVVSFNGIPNDPESFNLLDNLLSEQFYRLSSWKVGVEEINYRRFFTVNELISVKVETIKVFHKTHALIEQWIKDGKVTGLRVDHIDGLYHPAEYLERLQEKVGDVYVTVEKILELQEEMPHDWKTQGTSGYEFLNYLNGVFCQSEHESEFQNVYTRFTGTYASYEQLVTKNKHLIIDKNLGGDVDNLAQRLKSLSGQTRQGADFTAYGLKRSLSEVLASFPVYRTYIDSAQVTDADRGYIQTAIAQAKEQIPRLVNELDYIEKILLRQDEDLLTESQKEERLHFVMKFQQLTGPLMAKGVEDTTLYIYNRLLSLNEVGGNPSHFGIALEQFHDFNRKKCDRWMYAMNASATHDTKRGEDVRARLNVLSELPADWEEQVQHWAKINRDKKSHTKGKSTPDRNDEYFLYQTLVGSFPFAEADCSEFRDRIKDYIIKAIREAKVHTTWIRPDETYENGYLDFIDKLLDFQAENEFLQAFRPFQQQIANYGIFNSLSQVLLKNTTPGVPDLYQGCELWDFSLVDPDNRRPVDYAQRQTYLQEIQAGIASDCLNLMKDLLATKEDGRVKLFLTYQVLQARQKYQSLFQQGNYQPLEVSGIFADHVVAFARTFEDQVAIALAPRFLTQVIQLNQLPLDHAIWQNTQIDLPSPMPKNWINAITQQSLSGKTEIQLGEALKHFPVALFISQN